MATATETAPQAAAKANKKGKAHANGVHANGTQLNGDSNGAGTSGTGVLPQDLSDITLNGASAIGTSATGQTQAVQNPTMLDKAILLQVDLRRMGNHRSISSEMVNADADKDLVHVSKTLLDSKELKAVGQVDEKLKKYLRGRCLPSIIRKGVFLLPIASIEKVTKQLSQFAAEREQKVETFIALYPNLIMQAEQRLRELFDAKDYPGTRIGADGKTEITAGCVQMLRSKFSLEWNYVTFGTPDVLAEISQDLFDEERAKMNAQWSEAQDMVQNLLRLRVQEMVQGIKHKLEPGADGKLKTFSKSAVEKLNEFFNEFDALNITDDLALKRLVEQGRKLLDGVDANAVRKSADLQASLKSAFGEIETQLETMVVNKPKRMISFED